MSKRKRYLGRPKKSIKKLMKLSMVRKEIGSELVTIVTLTLMNMGKDWLLQIGLAWLETQLKE